MSGRRGLILLLLLSLASCTNRLTVTSDPTGARVAINEEDYGTTPLTLDKLDQGVYAISVTKSGYHDWNSEIEVKGAEAVNAVLMPVPPAEMAPLYGEPRAAAPAAAPAPASAPAPSVGARVTKLTVFVEPANGDVYIDDQFRGTAQAGRPVIMAFPDVPTMTLVVVRAPGYQEWRGKVVLESLRDNHLYVTLDPLPMSSGFIKDDELLRMALSDVVQSAASVPGLARGARIEVLSLVRRDEDDEPMTAMVKDVFIEELVQAGFTPSDRDDDVLVRLAHSTAGSKLPYRVLTRHASADKPFEYDAEILAREEQYQTFLEPKTTRVTESTPGGLQKVTITEDQDIVRFSHTVYPITGSIPTADQFLAFRILDLGISKAPVKGAERPEPMMYRHARVRMHVRVIDAKQGTVRWAGILAGQRGDEVPTRVASALASPNPDMYSGILPELEVEMPKVRAARSVPDVISTEPTLR